MQPIQRSQLVSVALASGASNGAKFYFPDIPELRDAVIDGLELYTSDELTTSPNGRFVTPSGVVDGLVLNLVQESDRRGQDFPATALVSSQYGGIWKEFTGWRLNWQKTYVQVVTNGAVGGEYDLVVNVFYHYAK